MAVGRLVGRVVGVVVGFRVGDSVDTVGEGGAVEGLVVGTLVTVARPS